MRSELEKLELYILKLMDDISLLSMQLKEIKNDVSKYEIAVEVIKGFDYSYEQDKMLVELKDLIDLKKKEYVSTHDVYTSDIDSLKEYYNQYVELSPDKENDDVCKAVEELMRDVNRNNNPKQKELRK